MKHISNDNERRLGFVLKHYRHGALDTRRAMKTVMERAGIAPRRIPLWRFAAAAAVILLLAGAAMVWYNRTFGTVELTARAATETFTLPDGTTVVMRRGTTLAYKRNAPRTLSLNGTAYFSVRHDEGHPFTVSNAISTVRVLGTQFTVNSPHAATTDVYVSSGRVLFTAAGSARGVVLTSGMKALLNNGDSTPRLVPAGSVNQTAWATRIFHFDNTPMPQVLSDLSACYGVRLSCDDTTKRLTGDIHADSLNSVIKLIEQTLEVKIYSLND